LPEVHFAQTQAGGARREEWSGKIRIELVALADQKETPRTRSGRRA
jgi:hypothetical protein